jgi:hypothetical protein
MVNCSNKFGCPSQKYSSRVIAQKIGEDSWRVDLDKRKKNWLLK